MKAVFNFIQGKGELAKAKSAVGEAEAISGF